MADGSGLHIVSQRQLDPRLLELMVSTGALRAPAKVRILLPSGFVAGTTRRYPVLYLLHGTSGNAADWTALGGAEQTTAGLPVIVVMPDIAHNDDGGGWCTNWYNRGAGGVPKWETFHINQLIPWVDANLPTRAARAGRAIAGLSQGGFCALSYAARHPDLFSVAATFSGADDTAYDLEARDLVTPIVTATELGLDRVPAGSMFGDRSTQEINWAAHDPATLAANLRGMHLFIYTGNGQPGPLDPPIPSRSSMEIEAGVEQLTLLFHNRLGALGMPSLFDDYGPGTHSWPYWARDLRQSIAPIMSDFAHPSATPAQITYTSADGVYGVFGWRVAMHRVAREFSTLLHARASGFELTGSGSATVLTPAYFVPGARYSLRLSGDFSRSTRALSLHADRRGHLSIPVPLGRPNPYQQYLPRAPSGTQVYTTRVSIARRVGGRH